MNIIEKFAAVQVKTASLISPEDQDYCQVQQQAYLQAQKAFCNLYKNWQQIEAEHKEILQPASGDKFYAKSYLKGRCDISLANINEQLVDIAERFIDDLVAYFNRKYHVSVANSPITKALLPAKPQDKYVDSYKEEQEEYFAKFHQLKIFYEDILAQIFLQLDGHSFNERAIAEIKEACHNAAWHSYLQRASYELKGKTISLLHSACRYRDWLSNPEWELQDNTKTVLRGIAHFETNEINYYPHGLGALMGWHSLREPIIHFPDCLKFKQLKLFKNGRVDLKFQNELIAAQFVADYLGLLYQEAVSN